MTGIYHITFPPLNSHYGHIVSLKNYRIGKTHPSLINKIKDLAESGITRVNTQRAIISEYTEKNLLCNIKDDVSKETYYFPNAKTITNTIRRTIESQFLTKDDQKNVENLLRNCDNTSIFYRRKLKVIENETEMKKSEEQYEDLMMSKIDEEAEIMNIENDNGESIEINKNSKKNKATIIPSSR